MKKIAFLALLASGLMAADSGIYVGAEVGNTQMNVTISNATMNVEKSTEGTTKQLKIGYYLDKNNRFDGFYQYGETASGHDGSLYGIGYDYLIGANDFKPFIGLLLGHVKYSQSNLQVDGSFIGTQAGLNYTFLESFSIEAGYRYMISNAEGQYTASTTKVEVDTLKNWFIGANYKF